MPGPIADDVAHRFEVRTTAESHFSWVRTRLSLERTLMSWVRTAISLIGFGFTIVQFFHYLGTRSAMKPTLLPEAPRYFGLALIGTGRVRLSDDVKKRVLTTFHTLMILHENLDHVTSPSFARQGTGR